MQQLNGKIFDRYPTAKLNFTYKAFAKIAHLVSACHYEVGWEGLVTRTGEWEFTIEDVLVYPQLVSPAYVEADDSKYFEYAEALTDEQWDMKRLNGHSHVKMPVTPSGTDMEFRENIVNNMNDGEFFIFEIINKLGARNYQIYIKENGVVQFTKFYEIGFVGEDADEWLDDAKTKVFKR